MDAASPNNCGCRRGEAQSRLVVEAQLTCPKAARIGSHHPGMAGLLRTLAMTALMAGLAIGVFLWRDHRPDPGPSVADVRRTFAERLNARGLALGEPVFIRIFKQEAALEVWMKAKAGWTLFQTYDICRYSGKLGPKLVTGDKQAPEGFYKVGLGQLNPASRWHVSFNLGFPNAFDRAHGRSGSFLMVHGGCSSAGCYAMTNAGVDDIYRLVEAGLRNGQGAVDVHIFPFRMTESAMATHASSKWFSFWSDLKAAHDVFERAHRIPAIAVKDGKYWLVEETAARQTPTLVK